MSSHSLVVVGGVTLRIVGAHNEYYLFWCCGRNVLNITPFRKHRSTAMGHSFCTFYKNSYGLEMSQSFWFSVAMGAMLTLVTYAIIPETGALTVSYVAVAIG